MDALIVTGKDIRAGGTGGHRRFREAMLALEEMDGRVDVVGPTSPSPDSEGRQYPTEPASTGRLPAKLAQPLRVRRALPDELPSYDLLLTTGLTNGRGAAHVKARTHAPLVLFQFSDLSTYRSSTGGTPSLLDSLRGGLVSWMQSRVLARTDLLIVQSEEYRDRYTSRYDLDPSDVRVLPNNIQPGWIEGDPRDQPPETVEKIGFIGQLIPRKGPQDLLEAFAGIVDEEPSADLHIAGDGPLRTDLESQARRHGLEDRVEIPGFVPRSLDFIAEMDLLVVPSRADSFPEVVCEALYAKTPVVASAVGGVPSQMGHNPELLFPPAQPQTLERRLAEIVGSKDRLEMITSLCLTQRERLDFDWREAFRRIVHAATGTDSAET
jgi:glycosyltransferase involved in cell wall biosynthesis